MTFHITDMAVQMLRQRAKDRKRITEQHQGNVNDFDKLPAAEQASINRTIEDEVEQAREDSKPH